MGFLAIFFVLSLAGVITFYLKEKFAKKYILLPPGPPADPLIGHLRLIPPEGQDVFFYGLGKTYGDVVQLKVLGRSIIILNSVEAAADLLDKRSSNYSDRPKLLFYNLIGMGDILGFVRYGKDFRVQRRMVQQFFTNNKRQEHRPIQLREARILAHNLLFTSEDWYTLLIRYSTAVIIETCYGHQITSAEDTYVKIAQDCCEIAAKSGPPGATLVDLLPFLRYLPSWFPGTYYAHFARESFSTVERLREYPFSQVTKQIAEGTARPSFLATQLEALREKGEQDPYNIRQVKAVSMFLYIAGADTTSSSLAFFVLAMVLHPECQARGQAEIEAVVGSKCLPEFHDHSRMPYLKCLVQETFRWNSAVPAGAPHMSTEDDIYRGMFIPKGSTIIANTRGMTLDDKIYKDPFKFDPTRYLPAPDGRGEPFSTSHFGFGRRSCAGHFMAEDSLWVVIATILATGTFLKPLDEDGKEYTPNATPITTGATTHPKPFKCRFEPRTNVAVELLKQFVEA